MPGHRVSYYIKCGTHPDPKNLPTSYLTLSFIAPAPSAFGAASTPSAFGQPQQQQKQTGSTVAIQGISNTSTFSSDYINTVLGISNTSNIHNGNTNPFQVLGIGQNATENEIKLARCVLAGRNYRAFYNGIIFLDTSLTNMSLINAAYKKAIQLCNWKNKNICSGFECVGNEDMAIGDLLPCFNPPPHGHKSGGLCRRCRRRSENSRSVYDIEFQLGRLLLYIGHPFIMNAAMVHGDETTYNYSVPAYSLPNPSTSLLSATTASANRGEYSHHASLQPGALRSIIDYHYFYKNEYKIIVEQDEREHSNGRYPVADELKGLIGREKFAGLPALIIRNNCRDDELQDPLQVRTIDAIINEYKAAVDRDDPFVRKSIIVFIDYREVSPHLAAAREFYNKNDEWKQVFSIKCRDQTNGTKNSIGKEISGYVEVALANIFHHQKSPETTNT